MLAKCAVEVSSTIGVCYFGQEYVWCKHIGNEYFKGGKTMVIKQIRPQCFKVVSVS